MPPVAMGTIFVILDYPNIAQLWWIYSPMHKLLELPQCLLEELSPNKMELGQNGHFYGLWVSYSDSRNTGRRQIKDFTLPGIEGSVVQHFRALEQETNSVDPLIKSRTSFWCFYC